MASSLNWLYTLCSYTTLNSLDKSSTGPSLKVVSLAAAARNSLRQRYRVDRRAHLRGREKIQKQCEHDLHVNLRALAIQRNPSLQSVTLGGGLNHCCVCQLANVCCIRTPCSASQDLRDLKHRWDEFLRRYGLELPERQRLRPLKPWPENPTNNS